MKKIIIICLIGLSLLLTPAISKANDSTSINHSETTIYSLANAHIYLVKNGSKLTGSASIPTGSSVSSRFVLQKKNGSAWNNISYSSYYSYKNYSYDFYPSTSGTYRVVLEYFIGSQRDSVISSSVSY